MGEVRLGTVRIGQVTLGQVRWGQVRWDQVRLCEVRIGAGQRGLRKCQIDVRFPFVRAAATQYEEVEISTFTSNWVRLNLASVPPHPSPERWPIYLPCRLDASPPATTSCHELAACSSHATSLTPLCRSVPPRLEAPISCFHYEATRPNANGA